MQQIVPPKLAVGPDSPYWGYAKALVHATSELEAPDVVEGLSSGLCQMAIPVEFLEDPSQDGLIGWWRPDPRAVLPLGTPHVSRSMKRISKAFRYSHDLAFEEVVRGCAEQDRDDSWITEREVAVYLELHRQGFAHSTEIWDDQANLVGGLFGLVSGGLFSGESMFHRSSNASKAAVFATIAKLLKGAYVLFDTQWMTPHLQSLGVVEISGIKYAEQLSFALGAKARWEPGIEGLQPVTQALQFLEARDGAQSR